LFERLADPVEAKVRLYILEGFNFAQHDLFGKGDPYLIVKCGKQ
jgi:hypothetical protein